MESYDVFAPFYDAVQGDRAEHARYIGSLIERNHPRAEAALEIACGTGSVLKRLQPHYEVTTASLDALVWRRQPARRTQEDT
jgi:ubiquinone/menaquinone biosynthesis C-methylase UbiE